MNTGEKIKMRDQKAKEYISSSVSSIKIRKAFLSTKKTIDLKEYNDLIHLE